MTLTAAGTGHADAHFRTIFVEFDDSRPFALQMRLRLAEDNRFRGERSGVDSLVVVRPSSTGATCRTSRLPTGTALQTSLSSTRPRSVIVTALQALTSMRLW